MPIAASNVSRLQGLLQSSPILHPMVHKIWEYDANTVVIGFDIANHAASLDIKYDAEAESLTLSALGREPQMQRHLRNMLIGKARLVVDSSERHVLGAWKVDETTALIASVTAWIAWLQDEARRAPTAFSPELPLPEDHASVYWWDKRSNFGDAVGPWLVERMTGRTPANSRNTKTADRPLLTVGSIIGQLSRDDAQIWGSGLIGPLEGARLDKLRRFKNVEVLAVRGKLTRNELVSKLGWNVPEVYGDPALLLPLFLKPEPGQSSTGKISVVPHYVHTKYFAEVNDEDVHLVDVRQGLEAVVSEIAASRVCISTSLHGIIVAQAYGVPWIWLRVHDHKLGGDKFKFDDFFSTVDATSVAVADTSGAGVSSLRFTELAETAALPRLSVSMDDLLKAFPLPRSTPRKSAWVPPKSASCRAPLAKGFVERQMSRLRRAKRLLTSPRRVIVVNPATGTKAAGPNSQKSRAEAVTNQALKAILVELREQHQTLREIRESLTTLAANGQEEQDPPR